MVALIEAVEWLIMRLGVVSGFATLVITIIVVVDVAGRAIFNSPLHSGVELSELLLVAMVFLGLGSAQQSRQNYAIDVASRHLPQWAQKLLELVGYAFCLGVVVLLAWPSQKQAFNSFARGEAGFGIVAFPLWPARFILAFGLWVLAVQFTCDILRLLLGAPKSIEPADTHSGVGPE
ncbi:MAG: TRAP transporter small permease [Hyphomicrobiaceae bacterium]